MLTAVMDFGELFVRQISVPRTEIIAVEAATPVTEAIRIAVENGVTKLPVYDDNLDQVTSILHLKDLLPSLLSSNNLEERHASELAREALFVPESISVTDLLVQMRTRRQHMAITLDEFGGTAGLVTLEDLLEQIVGEVHDSFDGGRIPTILPLPDGAALVDGLAQIENVNDHFGLNLYDPNYDTIAGYVLGNLAAWRSLATRLRILNKGSGCGSTAWTACVLRASTCRGYNRFTRYGPNYLRRSCRERAAGFRPVPLSLTGRAGQPGRAREPGRCALWQPPGARHRDPPARAGRSKGNTRDRGRSGPAARGDACSNGACTLAG